MQGSQLCHSRLFAEAGSRRVMIGEAARIARKYKYKKEKELSDNDHHNYFDQDHHHHNNNSSSFRQMSNLSEYSKEQYISAFVEAHSASLMHRNLLRQLRESESTSSTSSSLFPHHLSFGSRQTPSSSSIRPLQELHSIAEELKSVYHTKKPGKIHDKHEIINNNNTYHKSENKLINTVETMQRKSKYNKLHDVKNNRYSNMLTLLKENSNNNISVCSMTNESNLINIRNHTTDSTVPFGAWHEISPDIASHYTAIDKRVHVIIREACTPHYISPECIQRTLATFANQLHLHKFATRIDTLWTNMKRDNTRNNYSVNCKSNSKSYMRKNNVEEQLSKKQETQVIPFSQHLNENGNCIYISNTLDDNVRTEFTGNGVIENCNSDNSRINFSNSAMCYEFSIAVHNLYKELLCKIHWDNVLVKQQNKSITLNTRYGENQESLTLIEFDAETFQLRCNLCYHVIQLLVPRYGWEVGMNFVFCEIQQVKHTFAQHVEMHQMKTWNYATRHVIKHIQVMVEVLCEAIRYADYVPELLPKKADLEQLCTCATDAIACIQSEINKINNNKTNNEVEREQTFLHEEEILQKETSCKEELYNNCKLPLAAAPILALIKPQNNVKNKTTNNNSNNNIVAKENKELYNETDNLVDQTHQIETDSHRFQFDNNEIEREEEWTAESVQHFAQRYLIASKTSNTKCNNNNTENNSNSDDHSNKMQNTEQSTELNRYYWMPAMAWAEYIKAMHRCGASLSIIQKIIDDITDNSITHNASQLIQSVHIWNAYLYIAPASHALSVYKVNMPHYQVKENAATTASLIHSLLHNNNNEMENVKEPLERTKLRDSKEQNLHSYQSSSYFIEEAHQLYKRLQRKSTSHLIVGTVSVFLTFIELHKVQGHLKELLWLCINFDHFYIYFGLRLEWWLQQQKGKKIARLKEIHKQLFDSNYNNSTSYCENKCVRNNNSSYANITKNKTEDEKSKELESKYDIWFDEMQSMNINNDNSSDEKMEQKSNNSCNVHNAIIQTMNNTENESCSKTCNRIRASTVHSFIQFFKRACQHCTHGMPPQIQHTLVDAIWHTWHVDKTTNLIDNNNINNESRDEYMRADNNNTINAEMRLQSKQNNVVSVSDSVSHQSLETSPVKWETNLHKITDTNVQCSSDKTVNEEAGSMSAEMLQEMMSIVETEE